MQMFAAVRIDDVTRLEMFSNAVRTVHRKFDRSTPAAAASDSSFALRSNQALV